MELLDESADLEIEANYPFLNRELLIRDHLARVLRQKRRIEDREKVHPEELGNLMTEAANLLDAVLMRPSVVAVLDGVRGEVTLVSPAWVSSGLAGSSRLSRLCICPYRRLSSWSWRLRASAAQAVSWLCVWAFS